MIAKMMDTVSTFESSVNIYQTTRHIPEDSHIYIRRREKTSPAINLSQKRVQCREHGNEPSDYIKGQELFDQLRDY
jgi:hypothetical protein